MNSEYKPVPIPAASNIAHEYDKDQVIIVTWDAAHQRTHVTTYGRTKESSAQAAQGGNFVKKALGWPDRLCHDLPDWWRTDLDVIEKFVSEVNRRAEQKMEMTGKLEGAHYAAMTAVISEMRNING